MITRKASAALPYNPMPNDALVLNIKIHLCVIRKRDAAEKKARQI